MLSQEELNDTDEFVNTIVLEKYSCVEVREEIALVYAGGTLNEGVNAVVASTLNESNPRVTPPFQTTSVC